jgi:ABC-2 type transport system ATP-binding protein
LIEVTDLCKSYGRMLAVDGVSFTVRPGAVTAFVGPNGAGKSTVLRIALALDSPDSGSVLIQGRPYQLLDAPGRRVGALLDAGAIHPGQTGRMHLRVLARAAALTSERVERVLEQVGLESVAGDRVRTYSLGMRQRLGVAAALLGDPDVLILDEPTNGMDPEGIGWLQNLLRSYAAGRGAPGSSCARPPPSPPRPPSRRPGAASAAS